MPPVPVDCVVMSAREKSEVRDERKRSNEQEDAAHSATLRILPVENVGVGVAGVLGIHVTTWPFVV